MEGETAERLRKAVEATVKAVSLLSDELEPWRSAMVELAEAGVHLFSAGFFLQAAFSIRLALESAVQLHYFLWQAPKQRVSAHDLLEKWSRRGRAFTLKMVRSVPGIPGVYRKQLAKTYVKLAHLTHPSLQALKAAVTGDEPSGIGELLVDALDFIAYLTLHHSQLIAVREIYEKAVAAGMKRSSRYWARRLS